MTPLSPTFESLAADPATPVTGDASPIIGLLANDLPARTVGGCIRAGALLVEMDGVRETLTISDGHGGGRLLLVPALNLCMPELDGQTPDVSLHAVEYGFDTVGLVFTGAACRVDVTLERIGDCLAISSSTLVDQDCELTRLSVLPNKTALNLYDVVNFRNRHYTPNTWPELLLGGRGCETDTYSRDWQFAPHPSMMMLRKEELTLCIGALDLPTSYGLYFSAVDFHVAHCYLDYGGVGHGQKLRAGSVFRSPRICLFLDRDKTPLETAGRYTGMMVDQGLIPNPAGKVRHSWHREPLYCSWMDQGYASGFVSEDELGLQQLEGSNPTVEACTEELIRRAMQSIEEQRLPFRTILIDDGWQISRGQWEVQTSRFPDLRSLVDDIHARGMKAIIWWNWAEVFDDAQVDPAFLAGDAWRNIHGRRMLDYSNPGTQNEYLAPLFHKLLSSDEGCYDLDGIKTDFLADKVHADQPLYDASWRGEENYCYRLFKLFYTMMQQHKPDGCHIGCAGHPYLAELIDINRTYDVATSNYREHLNRAFMLQSLTPGCPVAFDLHNYMEKFEEYFNAAREHGMSVEVGNILGMKQDRFTPWTPADDAFYDVIRRGIS